MKTKPKLSNRSNEVTPKCRMVCCANHYKRIENSLTIQLFTGPTRKETPNMEKLTSVIDEEFVPGHYD